MSQTGACVISGDFSGELEFMQPSLLLFDFSALSFFSFAMVLDIGEQLFKLSSSFGVHASSRGHSISRSELSTLFQRECKSFGHK